MRTLNLSIFVLGAAGLICDPCFAQETTRNTPGAEVNLALVATPSSSFVSGDTKVSALNDGFVPRSSADARHGSYGNWNRTGTQWVQYDWSQPISTKQIEVYWWVDGAGIGAPKSCRLLFWDGSQFMPVKNPQGLGVEADRFNATSFEEVTTSKLRLEIESDGRLSTGILEWKVYDSGKSPRFSPRVVAGVDRDVVLGGKTYLHAAVKSLYGPEQTAATAVNWSKASGPGEVTFADANSLATTASFSEVGEYVLAVAAKEGELSSSSTLRVKVVEPPPEARLDVVYTKHYKVDSAFWNPRIKAMIVNWIPHCIRQINRTDIPSGRGDGGIDNFVEAAKALRGEAHKGQKGYVFANAWVHQTVEAMCLALMVDPGGDKEILEAQDNMRATLNDWIPKILAAQEPDGYLQTAWTLRDTNRWRERWSPAGRGNHEGYTAGYFIESAINHYTLNNGKEPRLYEAAKRLADCWVANLGPGKKEWYDGHQEMEQALVRFGRFVNDVEGNHRGDAYVSLAKFLLDCRRNGSEYDQSHVPVQQQYEAVGHAVRAVYSYSGMADVAAETHDPDYQSAVMSLWDNLVNKKYYVTGGIGSGETSEGFGPNYSLRNNAYCEACSTCGLIFFQYKMNLAYHDARFVDLYEESMYNALLGALDLEGKNFYYDNPLVTSAPRYPWHACPCCVGNIPRTLLMLPTWTYAKASDGLYVNLFIGGTTTIEKVAGTELQVVQITDYPWHGKVSITVNPAQEKRFTLHIRVPQRQVSSLYTSTPAVDGIKTLRVNGSNETPNINNGYATITRTWKPGDSVEVEFPMAVQTVKAIDDVETDRGLVALRYGPLIYNLERADHQDITEPIASTDLKAEWNGDLLGGVMCVKGKFADGEDFTAVPNYARNNRLISETQTNAVPSGSEEPRRRRGGRAPTSIVWLKDGTAVH